MPGCWVTNTGNAFLDFGSMGLTRQTCPEAEFNFTSSYSIWLSYTENNKKWQFERYKKEILVLKKKGVEIIINGCGDKYSENEIREYCNFLKIINSYNGVDCAFFLNEYFKPILLDLKSTETHNFNKHPDSCIVPKNTTIINTHHNPRKYSKKYLKEKREALFEKKSIKMKEMKKKPVSLDKKKLNTLKNKQIKFLSSILKK
ncbi:MAG: hypothetical protein KAR87_03330 [Candidatus Aenigmarchaeota archaeon]|nr:hypothetical protein [Candidatus Aenigmarchaeota archaeon]